MWVLPVANVDGARGYLDEGFDRIKGVIDGSLEHSPYLSLGMSDCVDNATNLKHVVSYLRSKEARFVTLTQLASELH
jgi:hypothetical protein